MAMHSQLDGLHGVIDPLSVDDHLHFHVNTPNQKSEYPCESSHHYTSTSEAYCQCVVTSFHDRKGIINHDYSKEKHTFHFWYF